MCCIEYHLWYKAAYHHLRSSWYSRLLPDFPGFLTVTSVSTFVTDPDLVMLVSYLDEILPAPATAIIAWRISSAPRLLLLFDAEAGAAWAAILAFHGSTTVLLYQF